MRRVFVDIKDDSFINIDVAKDALVILEKLNFEDVVFVADDCIEYPCIDDLISISTESFKNTYVFTNGEFLTRDMLFELSNNKIDVVVPLDFVHPFTGHVYGRNDYNKKMENVLMRVQNSQIWQSISEVNVERVQQMVDMSYQNDIMWNGYIEQSAPDNVIEQIENLELPMFDHEDLLFVHKNSQIPNHNMYEEDLVYGNDEYSGTLHVSVDGRVQSMTSESTKYIGGLERGNISDLSV